jgi:phage-related protein (TIGR01555 family)
MKGKKIMKEKKENKKNQRADGWKNAMSGLETMSDVTSYTQFCSSMTLSWRMLADLWVSEGIASKIVSVVSDDMTREWISIENDSDSVLLKKLALLNAPSEFNSALNWMRLFGGSVVLIGIDDGRDLSEPVNQNAIKSINFLRVYDRSEIDVTAECFFQNPNDKNYGQIEYYNISPQYGGQFVVHKDRILEFKGIPVPGGAAAVEFYYFGMGVLQRIWKDLKDFGGARGHITQLLFKIVLDVYKFQDLGQLIASGNEDKLKNRLNVIQRSKSTINAVILDSEEGYEQMSSSLVGISDLLDRYLIIIAGISGIPVTRLFGRSPAGMNSTGEGDQNNYYDMIAAAQKNKMLFPLQKLVNYINASAEIKQKIENPTIAFNKLYQLTETQEMENKLKQSQIDATYIHLGVVTNREVRDSRFANGYSYSTVLADDAPPANFENDQE